VDIAQIVPLMGDEELAAYQFLVASGGAKLERLASSLGWGAGRTERVLSRLGKMKLARSEEEGRSDWVAVHPETAKLQYAEPLSGVIDAWQAQLEGIREQLNALSNLRADDTEAAGLSPVVTIEGVSDLREVLEGCAARCVEEVVAVQPLGRGAPALAREVVCEDSGAMSSAVDVRVLLPHLSRYDADVRECAERISTSGGEVRTTAASLPPLIVFDRSVAFLLDGEDKDKAHMVRHGALVDFIVHMVVSAWATSVVFQRTGGSNRLPESLTQETKNAIVQLLAAGYKDEVVARRLGIGVRTCRKYIAEMFGDLGAQSRFQAGWMVRDHMLAPGPQKAAADHSVA
jgi:sugar-specific transcriptional regulator TrmB/DNA-binding CsgD family transcriptional regulator